VKTHTIPSAAELERRYAAVMQNQEITAVSIWSEKNHEAKFDAQSYLNGVYADAEEFANTMNQVIRSI